MKLKQRRSKLPHLLRKMNKTEERIQGVTIDEKDEKKRNLHLDLLGKAKVVKEEGISG